MNRTSRIAVAVALCAAGSVLPASAAGHKSPAYYKMVKAKADGIYTFTEQNNYDSGGRETTTIKVEVSGKGGKLYLGPGDAYGWNKAANGPVTISPFWSPKVANRPNSASAAPPSDRSLWK